MKIVNGLDLMLTLIFSSLIGLAYAQCAMCGADHNASERGQGDSSGHGGQAESNRDNDRNDHDREAADSPKASATSATSGRRNEISYRMIERLAENPDFGNIEPGNAQLALDAGNFVKDTVEGWDNEKNVLDNLKEAIGIHPDTREKIDLPKDAPYHNEDRIVLP